MNLATFETYAPLFGDKDWQANYQKMVPLVESGHREVFTSREPTPWRRGGPEELVIRG